MTAVVEGVGKDAPTMTNEHGGKQSASPYRCDLLPPLALLAVAKVLKHGADKYGENNWHLISVAENVNHALTHLIAHGAGDASDDHLEHAATRILFALDQKLSGRPKSASKQGKPRVYIAGPISKGDLLDNINQATAAFTELMTAGLAPLCPHWSAYAKPAKRDAMGRVMCEATAEGTNTATHEMWLGVDLPWVAMADAVLRLAGESTGADREVAEAGRLGIPVFTTVEDVIAHFPN